jgi:tripartite-type tricarboxylate transporter receptor subunit TctC
MRLLAIAAALGSMVGAAAAQDYPTRPINVIVPAAAGGPTDAISRIAAQAMSKILGQLPDQPDRRIFSGRRRDEFELTKMR